MESIITVISMTVHKISITLIVVLLTFIIIASCHYFHPLYVLESRGNSSTNVVRKRKQVV